MTPETVQHLKIVESVIVKAKAILARHSYPDDLRSVVVMGTLTQIIEHHEAVLLSIRNDKMGSAFTLIRSIVEGVYRGLWINFCATDAEIQDFEQKDRMPLNVKEMAKAIDAKLYRCLKIAKAKYHSWNPAMPLASNLDSFICFEPASTDSSHIGLQGVIQVRRDTFKRNWRIRSIGQGTRCIESGERRITSSHFRGLVTRSRAS